MWGMTAVDAAKPDMVRITIDDTFDDEFLSDACGFDVVTHEDGHIVLRNFGRATGVISVNTLNFARTASRTARSTGSKTSELTSRV